MITQFLRTRGILILGSAAVGTGLRLTLPVSISDLWIVVSVVVAWPFAERFVHKYLLHKWNILPFHLTHDRHHKTPTADNGLPDYWVIGIYFVSSFVFWLLNTPILMTINAVVLIMLSAYEIVHYGCHCNESPKTYWGWSIRLNHLRHHNVDESRNYAMLFPWRK